MKTTKLALAISSLIALASCGTGDGNTPTTTTAPEITKEASTPSEVSTVDFASVADIGVHDPSVVKDGDTYYIFGSHLAAAKSTDLISWDYISTLSANHLVDESSLFNTYSSEFAEGIAWTDGFTGNWAANVIKAPNGKYWFYYNHCAQDNPDTPDVVDEVCWNRSYLGLAEADNIEGPYVDKGVFLRSGYRSEQQKVLDGNGDPIAIVDADGNPVLDGDGQPTYEMQTVFPEFADYPLDNGQTTWHGHVDPNAIDPTAFYDKDDNLWMVYGSYSGGIFVLALDETTGKPESGQGYGTHLVGGDFRAMEGAFVFYSPEADYYYLMWSVAGFDVNGGYNMRVARSKNPQGPYYDPAGVDVSTVTGTLEVGAKLMGGFEYTQELGDEFAAWGYQAPGHNSAMYDEASGKHLLVTHTRFPQTSTPYDHPEAHAVRTHEMFITRDGWLVASPQRYVPTTGDNVVAKDDIYGYYKFINQGIGVNNFAIRSTHIALNTDHTVTGSDPGAWYLLDPENIKLELASGTYVGVVKWQFDGVRNKMVPVISAIANDGATVFASHVNPITATATTLSEVQTALVLPAELTVSDLDFTLPVLGKDGTQINWQSSDEYYIGSDGSVFIPTPDRGNKTINLTATLTLNGQSVTKDFEILLQARPAFKNAVAHYRFEDNLNDSVDSSKMATGTGDRPFNTGTVGYADGKAGRALSLDGTNGIRFPNNLLNSYQYTVSYWMKPNEINNFTPSFFAAENDTYNRWINLLPANWDGQVHFWSHNIVPEDNIDAWYDGATGRTLTPMEWVHVAFAVDNGEVDVYLNGEQVSSLSGLPDYFSNITDEGVMAFGVNAWDKPFIGEVDEVLVYDYALTALDINAAAINNLTDPAQFSAFVKDGLILPNTDAVRDSFELPRVGPFVSGISWTSDNEAVIKVVNGMAEVTQPGPTSADATVTLTATINFQGSIDTKTFEVTVKSKAPAEFSFDGDLMSANNLYGEGQPTDGFIDALGGSVEYVDGVIGQALKLDGTNGVRLPDNLIGTYQYSVSFWIRPDAFTGFSTSFFGAANTSSWVSFVPAWGDGNVTRLWSGTAWYDADPASGQIPAQEWSHITFTVDNGAVTLYINGQVEFSGENYPNVFGAGQTTYFGLGVNHWDTPFNGAIDELKIYSDPIGADLVQALYAAGSAQ
ncbi:beta-xylosidase (plasmid) [Saccharobesus litoralis]|uniref:Beta-xylosidase n=1 Tax=Saccharobesus litoralis TaxID=2172099 RepID=A0A2S0VYA2_9ALTE|nr:LamG-like jellyroll fold domain-containing protein [Saccharobesus litoralis]AWB69155.1 beta-xylosidase [Saccharobesus litoralis]